MNEIVKQDEDNKDVSVMEIIRSVALNPDVNVDKIERLIEMRDRDEQRKALLAFNAAFANMDLPKVQKRKINTQTSSKYADLGEIQKVVDPVLAANGFSKRWTHTYNNNIVGTTCILSHKDGHSIEAYAEYAFDDSGIAGKRNKTDVHASASAKTYGKRDSLCSVLGLSLYDNDDDGNGAQNLRIDEKQKNDLISLLKKVDDIEKYQPLFLNYMGVATLDEILSSDLVKATTAINQKLKHAALKKEKEPVQSSEESKDEQ